MMDQNKDLPRLFLLILLALSSPLTTNVVAQQANSVIPSPQARVTEDIAAATDESYRIGPGDVLDIFVSKQPDYSRTGVRVDNSGMIQLSRDDRELFAACKTVKELASEVKERYTRYLRNPYVYVEVKEFHSQPVAVIGAVHSPGRFQLQRRVRLLELLTYVNGPNDRAGATIQIIRSPHGAMCDSPASDPAEKPSEEALIAYNLKQTLAAEESANPYVRPGDIIRVADSDQAYLIGAVKNPSPIFLKEPLTLSEAIARSGGLAPGANSEKISIVRHVPGSSAKTEIIANLKAINRRQAEDVVLQANDVIEVPGTTGTKKFLGDLMRSVVPRMAAYPVRIIP